MTRPENESGPPAQHRGTGGNEQQGSQPSGTVVPSVTVLLDAEAARRLTDRISGLISQTENLVTELLAAVDEARAGEAWRVLGYSSWTHYVRQEFGQTGRIRCGPYAGDERRWLVQALSERGMPTRAIASITGVSHVTVARDLAAVTSVTPDRTVTGADGKEYTVARREPDSDETEEPAREYQTDEELVRHHLGLDTSKREARGLLGDRKAAIEADLHNARAALARIARKAQDPLVEWTDELRGSVAAELDTVAGLATDTARLVRDPSASSLITDDELHRLLDEQGGAS